MGLSQSRLGLSVAARDDLDLITILDVVGEGHDAAVDLGTSTAVPNLRVHVVGEIQRRSTWPAIRQHRLSD